MSSIRFPAAGLMFIFVLCFSINSRTYRDDSLVVVEILAANGLDSVTVGDVSAMQNDRIGSLYLGDMGLTVLPECVGRLDSLTYLHLSRNQLTELPQSVGSLTNLTDISAYDNFISELPAGFSGLQKLKTIYLIRNMFTRWPEAFHAMPYLEMIDLGGNHLTSIPQEVCGYQSLKKLYINDNYLTVLPDRIVDLDLEVVHVAGNALCNVSPAITAWLDSCDYYKEESKWRGYQWCNHYWIDSLTLRHVLDTNGWTDVAVESVVEVADNNIVAIDLSKSNLAAHRLAKRSTETASPIILDSGIVSIRYLRSLSLAGNHIDTLPQWFAGLCHLKTLDISGNVLTTLPGFMTYFSSLESLNLAGNQIANLPEKTAQWAEMHAPGWKSTQLPTYIAGGQGDGSGNRLQAGSFFDGTTLKITFPQPAFAEVNVFALSGRKIAVLARQHFGAGEHGVNLKSARLARLPGGTYLVTVATGNSRVETLRFVAR